MNKLKLKQVEKNEWVFIWPRDSEKATDLLCEALDSAENGKLNKAKKLINNAIKIFPQHIDALHHLALFEDNEKESTEINEKATDIGLSVFPKGFNEKSKLEWGWIENRPFLKAYHHKGLLTLDRGETEEAINIFNNLLSWNPNDNQGVRSILADIYVNNKKWDDMLQLSAKYPEDCEPSMCFGLALALFKKREETKAKLQLSKSIKYFSLCGKILLEDNPKEPESEIPGYITHGGQDQAYEFWTQQGKVWKEEKVRNWLLSIIKNLE